MNGAKEPTDISTKQQRIAMLARSEPKFVMTSLAHHIDLDWLHEAHRRTRKDGARGIDGQSAKDYEQSLQQNLQALLETFKSGSYRAPPVKRVHIPKDNGATRPIGIPTFEDKVLQRAVAMVLDEVYEQDFLDCSYGFRRNRSAHDALEALWEGLMDMGGGFVVELDIESFFDTMDHAHLRSFLDQRVSDGVIRRAIGKWLKAGVLEAGVRREPESGTPQGGVISPLLANIYLHEVLDLWFERDVKPRLASTAFMVRYADDAVLAFRSEEDARRVMEVLPRRFEKFGLRLHPMKTRLVKFRRPNKSDGAAESGSFDFLGFAHFWGTSRKGRPVIQRKTAASRFRRALKRIAEWCKENRHSPLSEQHAALSRKLQGHYSYFGLTGNACALSTFLRMVERAWRRALDRRSQRVRMTWERFAQLLRRYRLPPARVVHSVYASAKP